MKTRIILTIGLLFAGISVFAQSNIKIGYTNVEFIVTQLPEYKQIEAELKTYSDQLQKQLDSKLQQLRTLEQELTQNRDNMVPTVYEDKLEEYQNLGASIQKFQREADTSLQRKQMELLDPVYAKIENAISSVATQNNYTHVFSDGMGAINILLYAREEDDITDKVLTSLGVSPTASDSTEQN